MLSATNNNQSGLFIDSGTSVPLTLHREWLYDEISPPINTIKVADQKKSFVKACGKVNSNVVIVVVIYCSVKINNLIIIVTNDHLKHFT